MKRNKLLALLNDELRPPHVRYRLVVVQLLVTLLPYSVAPRLRTILYRFAGEIETETRAQLTELRTSSPRRCRPGRKAAGMPRRRR